MARRGILQGERGCGRQIMRDDAHPHTKGRRSTFTYPEAPASSEGSAEIGPPPYHHRSDCNICRHQDGLKTGSERLDTPLSGGYIVEGEHFLVEHAPLQSSSAGTVIVEARRHLLDFGEMTPTESAELGSLLHRLVPAVKAATGVERVYFLALMEHSLPLPSLARTEEERGRTSRSGLPGAAAPSHGLAWRGRSDVAEDPSRIHPGSDPDHG